MGRLSGKVAIITGAANGQGACEAKMFAKEGAKVAVTDIDTAGAESVVGEIKSAGGSAIMIAHDVSSESDWAKVVAETVAAFGKIDILVNNAGMHSELHMSEIRYADWTKVVAVNLSSVFLGTQAVVPEMLKIGGGSIVNIASIAALIGLHFGAHYVAAKGGVRSFTRSTAITYAKQNIRANSVYPGLIQTNLTRDALANPETRAWIEAGIPLPRLGVVEDVAYGVLYLASDEAKFVTGSEMVIDGGTSAA